MILPKHKNFPAGKSKVAVKISTILYSMGTGQVCTKTLLHEGSLLHGGSLLHKGHESKKIKKKKK